ncbi:Phosphatidylglycerophosphatase A [Sulfidibacter corallicola]|uniref:Phosphatidylglycerophosphatase A n=1 Tax=Sulfidibacter corallicola TaxID=2818388 RepID=A0A8A4TYE1_SULCO|nr:phosphatidylglycerophosphatase A [Sulfidibacter corallicola]QTD54104.1 phosphatidylglycerophosphatase A [Sulfidibacter corallicola]
MPSPSPPSPAGNPSDNRTPPPQHPILHFINYNVATVCGVGLSPIAPGTVGSAAALLLIWLFYPAYGWAQVLLLFAVTALACYSANWLAEALDTKDPSLVVVDELAGMLATFLFIPQPYDWKVLIAGFLLFRLFDIWKPWPVNRLERLPGGFGIVLDDVMAGFYATSLLHLGLWYW